MIEIPTKIDFKTDTKIKTIYAGFQHSMAITNISFQVFVWGDGTSGQLGFKKNSAFEPVVLNSLIGKDIIKGSLGKDNSACLSRKGELFVFGSNLFGKLGVESDNTIEMFPLHVKSLNNVKKISLGMEHSAAITNQGELFTWGSGYCGQLGNGDNNNLNVPMRIKLINVPNTGNNNKSDKIKGNDCFVRFRKIKCGSFQTAAIDENDNFYIWGKGLLNLHPEEDKHKLSPDLVEFFKGDKKAKTIQCGHGNTIILTQQNEVYGIGDNKFYKTGGGEDKYVIKNPRMISFSSTQNMNKISDTINNVKTIAIFKIFANYEHCFAISSMGNIFAWGNPRLNRLTGSFEDNISKFPKPINIEWMENKGNEEIFNQNENDNENIESINNDFLDFLKKDVSPIDDYHILTILNNNLRIISFREMYKILYKLGPEYEDEKILESDGKYQKELKYLLTNIEKLDSANEKLCEQFIQIDLFRAVRLKEINPKKNDDIKTYNTYIPKIIREYSCDLEKIYSFFLIHPCIIMNILEVLPSYQKLDFIEGIGPLYLLASEGGKYNLSAIYFVAVFRISIDIDYSKHRNFLDGLFKFGDKICILNKLCEKILFNRYGKCILTDIFARSFKKLLIFSCTPNDLNDLNILYKIFKVLNDDYDSNHNLFINISHIKDILKLFENFYEDLIENLNLFPDIFIYCVSVLKKHMKKDQRGFIEDENTIKYQIINSLVRFIFSSIVGRMLLRIFGELENDIFICQGLDILENSVNRKLIENFTKIIGILFQRFSCGKLYVYREPIRKQTDNSLEEEIDLKIGNIEAILKYINSLIPDYNSKIFSNFSEKFPKSNFNFKENVFSGVIYGQLNFNRFFIYVDKKKIKKFVKILTLTKNVYGGDNFELIQYYSSEGKKEKLQNYKEGFFEEDEDNYDNSKHLNISKIITKQNGNHNSGENYKQKKPSKQIFKLDLEIKYFTNPEKFASMYGNLIDYKPKQNSDELSLYKCVNCKLILPRNFLDKKNSSDILFKSIFSKVENKEYIYISKILLNSSLNINRIKTLYHIEEELNQLNDQLILSSSNFKETPEAKYLPIILENINEINSDKDLSEEEKMSFFLNPIHKHIRMKINHVKKLKECARLIQDIKEAIFKFENEIKLTEKSYHSTKIGLMLFSNSLEISENRFNEEKKLTQRKMQKKEYTLDNLFKFGSVYFRLMI